MPDAGKTKKQLSRESAAARQRVAELKAAEAGPTQAESGGDATLEALQESEFKFRSFVEQSIEGFALSNEQGMIIEWNRALEEMTGMKREEALGQCLWDAQMRCMFDEVKSPKVLEHMKAAILNMLHTGQIPAWNLSMEVAYRRSDGSRGVAQQVRFVIKTARGFRIGITVRDMTERKRAEEEIRHQAETLAALHETAVDLAAQRSLSDLLRAIVVRAVNLLEAKEGGLLFYRPATDDLERVVAYNYIPDTEDVIRRRGEGLVGKVLESGRSLVVDDYNRWEGRVTERPKNFAIVGMPIFWGDRLLGVLDIVDDIPRTFSAADVALLERFTPLAAAALENNHLLRDLQEQMDNLRQMQVQLVQAAKLAAVGELAAGVAHELNNPLTSVLGYAEWLLSHQAVDTSLAHDLEIIAREARRARDIVRNLLDFARQTEPQRLPADVGQIVHQTLDLIRQHLEKSGVVIEEDWAPDIGPVALDSGQMKQVFLNLITNAAQAMPKGGRLRLRTARLGDEVAISVSDTGRGIPPELQARIFDPFFTTKPTGQGTGLGLSISLGIVEKHGGRVSVESQVGQGSTFTVWLPAEG